MITVIIMTDKIRFTFDCTLRGPFDNLFLIRFSASRTLCKGMIAVILKMSGDSQHPANTKSYRSVVRSYPHLYPY